MDPEIATVDGFTFKPSRPLNISIWKLPVIYMNETKNISLFFDYPRGYKAVASFSYIDENGKVRVFPESSGIKVENIRTNEGQILTNGGHFETPMFPQPHPLKDVKVC